MCIAAAQSGTPQAAADKPGLTIRSSVQEVVLDLTVRDSRGRIVRNLQPGDLEVLEDGVPQQIRSFRFIPGRQIVVPSRKAGTADSAPAPSTTANPLKAVNLICIVFHNLDIYDPNVRKYVADAIREFLGNPLQPDTWVGLFSLETDRLTVLYPFTTNREALLEAAAHPFSGITVDFADAANDVLSASPNAETLDVVVNGNPAKGGSVTASMRTTGGEVSTRAIVGADVATGAGANARRGDLFSQQRQFGGIEGQREIDQILAMIAQLQTVPGRKSVLLVSSGLATNGDPDLFKSVVDKANRADITVYALDVHGLSANSNALASENVLSHAASISAMQGQRSTGNGSGAVNMEKMRQDDYVTQAVRTSDTQASLRALSEQTGGFLIGSTNDFRKPFERLIEDVDTHYEVTYRPTSDKYDGRLRTIEVKTARAGLSVQSRTGYYALPALGAPGELPAWEMTALAALNLRKSPEAFPFRTAAYQFGDADARSRTTLAFEVPAAAVSALAEPGGKNYRINVGVFALVKNAGGQVVDTFGEDFPNEISNAGLAAARNGTLMFTHDVSLPPGRYAVETAVLDRLGRRAATSRIEFQAAEQNGVGLSSIIPVERLEAVKGAVNATDPLEFHGKSAQGIRVIPGGTAFSPGAKPHVYFVVYPDKSIPEQPKIRVDFLVEGRLTATQTANLPPAEANGAIPMLINAPADAGKCELRITAIQGSSQATQSLAYSLSGR